MPAARMSTTISPSRARRSATSRFSSGSFRRSSRTARIAQSYRSRSTNQWNHFLGESLHLFALRAELQQGDLDPDPVQRIETLCNRLRHADKSGAQTAIGDRVVLERD